MKKFLFTLVTLMMAGSLSAEEYFFVPDFELTQDQLGTTVNVDIYAHFDNMVSAYELWVGGYEGDQFVEGLMPEGAEVTAMSQLNSSARITYIGLVYNEDDDEYSYQETTCTPSFSTTGNYHGIAITSALDHEYALIDGEYVDCNAIKWQPGEFKMVRLKVAFAADFKGGDLVIRTQPACGTDPRGPIAPKGQDNFHACHITVEGAQPQIQDLTGTIEIGDVTEDGMLAINYTGNEDVTIVVTVNGEVAEMQNGMVQLAEGENVVVVTVSAEGYNDLVGTYNVTYTAPEPPVQTAAPSITYVENENDVVVTATGEGTVILYCNDQVVENPCTILKGDEAVTYTFTATAQVEGELISKITTLEVTVPAKEVGPVDPEDHNQGYWLVLVEHDGHENWIHLVEGANHEYTTAYDVIYPLHWYYGHFYYVINGVPYGAAEDETEAVFGYANANPLTAENTNTYTVPVGYRYQIGLNFVINWETGELIGYAAYVAQGNPVSVDELSEGKTVAGVRYFNMAGQEMQEANGMTIVVTTYTDGTTSAVKVMK